MTSVFLPKLTIYIQIKVSQGLKSQIFTEKDLFLPYETGPTGLFYDICQQKYQITK